MDAFSYELLSLLKNQFLIVRPKEKFQVSESGPRVSARQFYLENPNREEDYRSFRSYINPNLFEPMSEQTFLSYCRGSGGELRDKMFALRSSSAMTYNLFGNDSAVLYENGHVSPGEYRVFYEWQYPTLRREVRGQPANIDAVLYCQEAREYVACEMKLTEWLLQPPGKLKKIYLDPSSYPDEASGRVFTEIAQRLTDEFCEIDCSGHLSEYPSCFRHYDAFQMFKHALAMYHCSMEIMDRDYAPRKLTLLNCVWQADVSAIFSAAAAREYTQRFACMQREYQHFYHEMLPVRDLFRRIGIDFDIMYLSLSDCMEMMRLEPDRKTYLERYQIR